MADTKKTAVVIENESEMIDLIRLILERRGLEVVGTMTGREGSYIVRRLKPNLVLIDPKLPDMDGWEVYRQIRADEELEDTRVVVISPKAGNVEQILRGDQ